MKLAIKVRCQQKIMQLVDFLNAYHSLSNWDKRELTGFFNTFEKFILHDSSPLC
jgi:hypothetical protein